MPTYEYRCKGLRRELEVVQSFTDDVAHRVPRTAAAPAAQGVRAGRHHVQGHRLLQDRQPLEQQEEPHRRQLATSTSKSTATRARVGVGDHSPLPRRPHPHRTRRRRHVAVLVVVSRPRRRLASSSGREHRLRATDPCSRRRRRGLRRLGLLRFLDDVDEVAVDTPYGPPSAPVTIGDGRRPPGRLPPPPRRQHELPPHRIPYRANVWAMRELGVRAILAPCAARLAAARRAPRATSSWSTSSSTARGAGPTRSSTGPRSTTSPSPTPTTPELRATPGRRPARELGLTVHDGGTVVVVQGPRFSTRAESALVPLARAGRSST